MATKTVPFEGINISINFSADDARHLVNRNIVPELGTGLGALEPDMIIREQKIIWRVPVVLSLPHLGDLGEVGYIEVDAQNGRILSDQKAQDRIVLHAKRLYAGAASLSPE